MSVEATDGEVVSLVSTLRGALIALGRLTPEDSMRIDDVMRSTGLGFGDAGVRLGLITPEEIEEAIRAAREGSQTGAADGVFDGAFHKRFSHRNLPVKYIRTVKPGPSLILAHNPYSTYSEQIRALRTELLLLNGASRGGVSIAILSPCRGEGRTQLCAELATAFSQLGQHTLLLDADLRRPRVHTLFEPDKGLVPEQPFLGLGPALASGGVPELLGVTNLPHLSVLTAGPTVPNPLELLTNGNFQRQLSDLRKQYGIIIIDTPPIVEFADGLAIAAFVEQVVIVGRSGSTPHRNMKEMLRRMGSVQSRIVGAVMNSF